VASLHCEPVIGAPLTARPHRAGDERWWHPAVTGVAHRRRSTFVGFRHELAARARPQGYCTAWRFPSSTSHPHMTWAVS
jgi:hypothetical protein